ncbi:substrate-binding periplasmic protein [Rheinheimera soli]|jgi:ABC-type amino acid transport substrate-binding protein|uniref:substrate-binding periplasmic protein n=1 Tax=Rheinheimera soli TaxID=443616 RepID=UPI001E4304B9|nr:transporter substrate-binding domain-containing protein [Rheinheimera soli]
MKWIFFLLCIFNASTPFATSLSFCQESDAEAPNLADYDIGQQSYKGVHAAVVAHALSTLKIDFTIKRLPWLRCMHDAQSGKFDGIIGIGWSGEWDLIFDFPGDSEAEPMKQYSITRADYYIYSIKGNSLSWDGYALSGLRYGIAAPKGYVVETLLKNLNAHKELDTGLAVSFELLVNKRVDGVVMTDSSLKAYSLQYKGTKIVKLSPVFYQQHVYMAFSLKSTVSNQTRNLIWQQIALSKRVIANSENS